MRGLERGQNALKLGAELKRSESFRVGGAQIFRAPDIVQIRMLGTDAGIVEPRADRVALEDLAVLVLQKVSAVAVQHAGLAPAYGGGMLKAIVNAAPGRFDSVNLDV